MLTEKEKRIIALVSAGLSNPEVAERLELAEVTVRCSMNRIYKKLRFDRKLPTSQKRAALAEQWQQWGCLEPCPDEELTLG